MNKNLIGIILIAVGGFILMGFAWPKFSYIRSLDTAIEEREEVLTSRTAIIDRIENLYSQYQDRESEINKLSLIIPAKKSTPEIITGIENITLKNGITLSSLNLSESTSDLETYNTMNLDADLTGSYTSIISMLKDVEKNIRLFDVSKIQISPKDGTSTLNANIIGNMYFLK